MPNKKSRRSPVLLAAYTVRVSHKPTGDDKLLGKFCEGHDFLDFLFTTLNKLNGQRWEDQRYPLLLQGLPVTKEGRTLAGKIESGQYGVKGTMRHIEEGRQDIVKETGHADMLPFFYLFHIPTDTDKGYLILSKRGTTGIRKVLGEALVEKFAVEFEDFSIKIQPLVSADLINQYLSNGEITKLRFIHFGITSDIADSYDQGHREVKGSMQLVASVSRGDALPVIGRIKDFLNKKRDLQGLIELTETKFTYDTIKVEVRVGRNKRTVDLGELISKRAPFDVSDQVSVQDGHPDWDELEGAARELLSEIATELYT